MRKFEIVKRIENALDVRKPNRSTVNSAGYDFYAVEDVEIQQANYTIEEYSPILDAYIIKETGVKPTLIRTGIKAKMGKDEFLMLANRSSNPKKGLFLANGVGIIDSDYYNNENNDGEIMFAFLNLTAEPITIKKGDKIGQGVFMKYLTTDDDLATGKRTGGFGSTDNQT